MADKAKRALPFDTFGGEIRLELDIRLLTGLHIGAGGDALDPTTVDSMVVRDVSGRPYLPGSSLKGAWRAHMERLVRSLGSAEPPEIAVQPGHGPGGAEDASPPGHDNGGDGGAGRGSMPPGHDNGGDGGTALPGSADGPAEGTAGEGTDPGAAGRSRATWISRLWCCDPLADACIPHKTTKGAARPDIQSLREQAIKEAKRQVQASSAGSGKGLEAWRDELLTRLIIERSCDICLLFGSPWIASRVWVRDAHLTPEWQTLAANSPSGFPYERRHGVGIDRDSGRARDRILYEVEVVPPSVSFRVEILARDLAPVQRRLFFASVLELLNGRVDLGGKGSRGLGKIEVSGTCLEETTRETLFARLSGEQLEPVVGDGPLKEYVRTALRVS